MAGGDQRVRGADFDLGDTAYGAPHAAPYSTNCHRKEARWEPALGNRWVVLDPEGPGFPWVDTLSGIREELGQAAQVRLLVPVKPPLHRGGPLIYDPAVDFAEYTRRIGVLDSPNATAPEMGK